MNGILLWISIFGICWAPLFPAFFVGREEDLHKEIQKFLDAEGRIKKVIGSLLMLFFGISQRWMLFSVSLVYITFYFLKGQP